MSRQRQFRINGLWSLMMLTFVCAITAAGARYAYISERNEDPASRGVFVIFSLAAPVVVLLAVSVGYRIYRFSRRNPNHILVRTFFGKRTVSRSQGDSE